ncbi:centrosomal protein of 78 kDa [Kryptolebias marmoratus]|uniref:Centrosomal protein 78 n=1 Tax=Kryptolebias marmoratus TaxID=37003 RepID=A0A3Q3EJ23_KRYMA|nr:centrosomal protein of 78 kDa [Kryptolebias marmoratus]
MVQDGAQIRRQGAHDFMAYYDFACARQDSVPLPAVKTNLDKGMLDFNGDRLKLIDWTPVLHSISINKHLHHIAISSTASLASGDVDKRYHKSTFKRKIPAIRSKDMTFKLCKALRECLTVSPNLKTLQLNGLPLRERDLITLTKGLAKCPSLENLSLANCPISDEGLETICQSVKYSTSIRTIDFTGCSLTWRGAEHMANIIKHQGMQRHGTAWAESLRYRLPQFEGMGGLRRVTLNSNTLIGDRGAAALAHELAEDLWVKAVDLQRCGLSNEGARRLLEALKTNSSLCVLDIRNNPLVDKVLIKTVIEKVLMNAEGQSPEYCWIKPKSIESPRISGPKRRAIPSTVKGKPAFKMATHKGTSTGGRRSGVAPTKTSCSHSSYVPWRAAARAGRQRGMPPGITVKNQSFQGAASVKVTVESDSEEEEDSDEGEDVVVQVEQRLSSLRLQDRITGRHFERVQMELKECRLRLAEEHRARLKAESRLMEYELENSRLHDANRSLSEALSVVGSAAAPPAFSALEDEAVLESIENSFTKFHAFLDLLKDAGLGQLASVAGINTSDFQPLGKPQLSSTVGPHLDGAASLTIGEFRDVQAETDAAPLVPNLPGGAVNAPTHRSPPPLRDPLHQDRLLDVTFSRAGGDRRDPVVDEEGEPHQYLRPDIQPDSGSERSFRSNKSFDNISLGKTFQTQPSSRRGEASSYRSNSSRENGFNNSHVTQSNGSHGGSSDSLSEIISDRAESVGSVRSRNRGMGRLVTVSQSGSERSERKTYPGRAALKQIRSLGESDDESF